MFLHSSTAVLARCLHAAPGRTTLLCSFHTRYPLKDCIPKQLQEVSRGTTTQQTRQYFWSRLQCASKTHHPLPWLTGNGTAPYSTTNTSNEHQKSTSTGVFTEASNTAEGDDVDIEALVELEVELYRQEGFTVPSRITPTQWKELVALPSVNGRKKFLTFLFKKEKVKEKQKRVKEMKKEEREEKYRQLIEDPPQGDGHIEYGLWKNSIFLRINDNTMNHVRHCRVIQAMLFGQPLVVDMGFDEHMSRKERQNCARQLQLMMSLNRIHRDPYSLELHNAPPTLDTMVRLERLIPTLYKPEFPMVVNPGSYLEKYPREQLVYLTPHSHEELLTYDHNAVYIIGGFVDKSSGEPLTLAKAKREGIRMQKFPLDRYLHWGSGKKSLTLNQVLEILLDLKLTGDWSHALRHIPTRKLQQHPQTQEAKEKAVLQRIEQRERRFRKY